jgi:hypothetical protein
VIVKPLHDAGPVLAVLLEVILREQVVSIVIIGVLIAIVSKPFGEFLWGYT